MHWFYPQVDLQQTVSLDSSNLCAVVVGERRKRRRMVAVPLAGIMARRGSGG